MNTNTGSSDSITSDDTTNPDKRGQSRAGLDSFQKYIMAIGISDIEYHEEKGDPPPPPSSPPMEIKAIIKKHGDWERDFTSQLFSPTLDKARSMFSKNSTDVSSHVSSGTKQEASSKMPAAADKDKDKNKDLLRVLSPIPLLSIVKVTDDSKSPNSPTSKNKLTFEPFHLVRPPTAQDEKDRSASLGVFLNLYTRKRTLDDGDSEYEPIEKKLKSCPIIAIDELPSGDIAMVVAAPAIAEDGDEEEEDEDDDEATPKIRSYQTNQWDNCYQELVDFKSKNGHCCVPHDYKPNPPLARWVKRQRYQFKQGKNHDQSDVCKARWKALSDLGFVFSSHASLWHERWTELKVFCMSEGHCNVPSNFLPNRKLATWVKCQRRQYKALKSGGSKKSTLTPERVAALNSIGFHWNEEGLSRIPRLRSIV